ncbi:phosphoethanolamine--lipid A transferase [Pseudochrobactrum algeriensis]|uniref:phosphoethanolamine transferase n=2 Tax=Pseudochrobactrum algeriensis TaxID=2834768 RepID=UPI001BCFFC1C|nr:phosphoethanolamine--lipid A transferase [Pseudochrobactrum algeriensis]MBX8811307.1 phosphoethanolamine--lipid A transferase [Ochrobactrum sp. MR34]QVQ38084.1 phosphoethanolamine--lipid A transferase [Pseudochrobactrum algeriensis]QVQ45231.1 phosphoethanolamine--lipid A transferase [Pseudochrobactrum algeriensis]
MALNIPAELRRPHIESVTLSIITAGYLTAVNNATFWHRSEELLPTGALLALVAGIFCLLTALCITVSVKYLTKPLFIFLIMVSATASWFIDQFGTIIDVEMLQSAIDTTNAEAGHLISFGFIRHVVIFGILPSLLILWVKIEHRSFLQKVKQNSVFIFPALFAAAALFMLNASTFTSLGREHKEWIATLNPVMPIGNAVKLSIRSGKNQNIIVQPLGTDAKVANVVSGNRKPRLTIVIAGETARAESFSLGGYKKNTNPELARQDITYFSDTSSCGTITAVSLPCMFSVYTRDEYTHEKGLETENLLDVLKHAGVHVEWWDNNTGHKSVADRVTSETLSTSDNPKYCKNGECLDGIFLDKLDTWMSGITQDTVLVMHQLGSHGPAYYLRYPDEYRRFTPDCQSAEFSKCSREEILNAYDNSIAYTDHIISSVIDRLRDKQDKLDTSMIYMSDHGESVGEFGLYLHGAPYFVAPSQQTHVPYVLWLGKDAKATIRQDCLAKEATEPQSHDKLFHTVLGLMQVKTQVYSPALDTLSSCRINSKADLQVANSVAVRR